MGGTICKNHYTDEFKQIVSLYKTGKTAKQLSSDYQVCNSLKWIHELLIWFIKAKDNRSSEENELIH
ncbi:hypothetical protein [Spiroplasma poulsonii]|uniref:hypothetical protein n=1 Tax=Spiroplasma poulsonii TaxID=2138 RepID=UPI001F4CE2FE|nr:hypothetical protein [Spiroplasma poulsonii]UNF61753.1 hypothetical protein MNU24_07535 [Spiroplasma poulsonii]